MIKILKKLMEKPVIYKKQRKTEKDTLSIKSVADTTGNSIETILSMIY
jgi:hypothetical protein